MAVSHQADKKFSVRKAVVTDAFGIVFMKIKEGLFKKLDAKKEVGLGEWLLGE